MQLHFHSHPITTPDVQQQHPMTDKEFYIVVGIVFAAFFVGWSSPGARAFKMAVQRQTREWSVRDHELNKQQMHQDHELQLTKLIADTLKELVQAGAVKVCVGCDRSPVTRRGS